MKQEKNVIIAGSTKCGTTSLFRYLSSHPQVCASVIKETRFFWSADYPLAEQKLNGKSVLNYDDFFSNCPGNQWKLEATPDYMYSEKTAAKIKTALPDCRIIFILRNPVERVISWFKYSKQTGRLDQKTQFDDYLEMLKRNDPMIGPQHLRALEQGRYAHYLKFYFNLFEKQCLFTTFYNDLQADPKRFISEICEFLEIDNSFYNSFDFKIYNQSLNIKNPEQFSAYLRLKKLIRSFNNKLPQSWGNFFRKLLKSIDVVYLKNKSTAWDEIKLSSSAREFINEYYKNDKALLEKMLKKKITW